MEVFSKIHNSRTFQPILTFFFFVLLKTDCTLSLKLETITNLGKKIFFLGSAKLLFFENMVPLNFFQKIFIKFLDSIPFQIINKNFVFQRGSGDIQLFLTQPQDFHIFFKTKIAFSSFCREFSSHIALEKLLTIKISFHIALNY